MAAAILAALGIAEGTAGAIQANQRRQKQKGVIGKAYDLGRKRLDLTQLDTKQSIAEALGARGLGTGASIAGPSRTTAEQTKHGPSGQYQDFVGNFYPVMGAEIPGSGDYSVGGAHTLGEQQTADLGREQQLEQDSLAHQRDAAYQDVNAQADQSIVNAVGGGLSSAVSGVGTANAAKGVPAVGANTPQVNPNPTIAGAFGLDPLTARPVVGSPSDIGGAKRNADFNVFNQG